MEREIKTMKPINEEYQTRDAILVGPVIDPRTVVTGERLGGLPENQERLLCLARNYRLRRHSDGWFVDGKGHKSQIWEFGIAKLGLTVDGSRFVNKCRKESVAKWLKPQTIGDDEANFWCDWTDENLANLTALTGLQKRKKPKSSG